MWNGICSPLVLEFELQLQALHFHLSLPLVFQDLRIWFSVFWRRHIPGTCPVLGSLEAPKCGQVAHHVSISATVYISLAHFSNHS